MRHKYCQKCIIRASSWGWQAFQNEGTEAFEDFFHLYIVRTRQLLPKCDLFVACVLWTSVCVGLTFTVIFSFQIYTTFWGKKALFGIYSVIQSCPALCDPMNHSMPGLPVQHQLPEFTQTHVHWVGDAIQPSHPLSSPSPPTFNLSQHQGLFQWLTSLHQVAKVSEFQLHYQSFWWIFRTSFL